MKSRFNLLFVALTVVLSITLMACPHPDNKRPENVIRNDDFTKMGGHGYEVNHQPGAAKPDAGFNAPAQDTGHHEAAPAHGAADHNAAGHDPAKGDAAKHSTPTHH